MTSIGEMLYGVIVQFRLIGIIIIAIVAMAMLITEGAKSRLSPGKIFSIAGSGILAGVLFWILPSVINYASQDANTVVPNAPVGGFYR